MSLGEKWDQNFHKGCLGRWKLMSMKGGLRKNLKMTRDFKRSLWKNCQDSRRDHRRMNKNLMMRI